MKLKEAVDRILQHAGYTLPNDAQSDLAKVLWEARNQGSVGDVEGMVNDIIDCLSVVNTELNLMEGPQHQELPRPLVGAMAEICADLAKAAVISTDAHARRRMAIAAWIVQLAWYGVAAGDTPDIRNFVRGESAPLQDL